MSDENDRAIDKRESYWNSFYSNERPRTLNPSQFAVFVNGEVGSSSTVVDIGCGTGRDSFFFASHGHDVVAVDGSVAAVEHCRAQAAHFEHPPVFEAISVTDPNLVGRLKPLLEGKSATDMVVYARFFVHAITDEEELAFLKAAASLCGGGGHLAVEFRTKRDAEHLKVTPDHYRRFVDPLAFLANAADAGFRPTYFVEGYGYAKYKLDDAYVARLMLKAS